MPEHDLPDAAFPVIVAHRGASSAHPENTLAAFEAAVVLGADLVELDVRLSRDGVAVVMHDPSVDRTTDGSGAVHELTAEEISAFEAGSRGAPARVPTLREVLELVSGRAGVALEIKNVPGEAAFEPGRERIVEAVHGELDRTAFDGPVLVVSFNPASIAASKAIASEVPTGLLTTEHVDPREALAHVLERGHDMVLPGSRALIPAGERFVSEVHRADRRVGTWTIDDAATVRMLLDRGLDAIASNDPAMALAVRAGRTG